MPKLFGPAGVEPGLASALAPVCPLEKQPRCENQAAKTVGGTRTP